jgi:hypothetical protein
MYIVATSYYLQRAVTPDQITQIIVAEGKSTHKAEQAL